MNPRDPNAIDSRRRGERHVDDRLAKTSGIVYVDYDTPAIAEELHKLAGTWPKIVHIDDATFWPIVERHKLPPLDETEVQKKIDHFLNSPGSYEEKARYIHKRYSRRMRHRITLAFGEHTAEVISQRRKAAQQLAKSKTPTDSAMDIMARNLGINRVS